MAYIAVIRYGSMRNIGQFKCEIPDLKRGQRCIVRTERGTEIGEVVSQPAEIAGELTSDGLGQVVRRAGREDLRREREIETVEKAKESQFCERKIGELELPIKLVDVEHLFGGERIVFYFRAEQRVDFRQLVRDWPKTIRPASRCGRSAFVMRPACWAISSTAGFPFVAAPLLKTWSRSL